MRVMLIVIALVASFTANSAPLEKPTISESQAKKIALAKVPNGHIRSAELENEHNALVWSFDISRPHTRTITEILANAKTGEIVDIQSETPRQQRVEAAEDQAKKN